MKYEKKNRTNASNLRKNMTKEERHLWYDCLSTHPLHFYRQRRIGNYIVDFYCAKAKLIIELDGSQHFEQDAIVADQVRTDYLESLGLLVVRIPNNEIFENFTGVCDYIDHILEQRLNIQPSSDQAAVFDA